ncbi:glycosyl hydrolase family 95 catalytic domain-containing protein [Streptomyces pseudogriseolus]|uniref:glycosyl hydrolase family 95 catalytic domain-containing protein n=1 Tax=Streptomyces pseudogriseolus TaxID=36817 RepID=UPI003FA2C161
MTSPPVHGTWEPRPAARWEDAYLSGNGRHGALVLGDPDDERTVVTHHTLVRPDDDAGGGRRLPPLLADALPGVQDRLLSGDLTAAEDFTDGRPLQWVRPFHPAFQIRLRHRAGAAGLTGYRREADFTTGEATVRLDGRTSRVFVSRADDVIVQHVTGRDLSLHLSLDHRLPNAPAALRVGHGAVLTPEGALLSLRARHPGSDLAYTGVTVAAVTGGRTELAPPGVRVTGARSVLLLTRVRRHTGEADVVAEGRALRDLLTTDGRTYDTLLDRHLALHRTAYERVTLDLDADPAERALPGSALLARPRSTGLLERLFAAGRYHLLSASGLLPPRLTGLWTGDWDTAWSGALTLDANLGLQTASAASAALPEVTEALAALVQAQLPHWRDNARAVFGTRGVVAPAHTDGESGHSYHFSREYPLHLWTAGADWLLKPLVDHDETYGAHDPRTAAALAETADFYEDFLTRTGPDGLLAVVPSYSPENRPANGSWGALNAAMDLSAARHALHTAAAYHPDRAGRLRALAGRLPPHRVNADGALAEWAWPGLKDTYDHRHLSHLYGVWPLDEITPDETPDLAAAARRALELRGPENDSAHGHLHHALIAARLRDGRRVADALGRVLDGDFFHDSLMSAHYPHRNVYNADAAHTLPAVLIEALVQSAPDRLVLLPAALPALPRGRLTGIRTRFGAALDLTWTPDGGTAVLRPDRTHRITLWTPAGAEPLDLAAGEERVVALAAATR